MFLVLVFFWGGGWFVCGETFKNCFQVVSSLNYLVPQFSTSHYRAHNVYQNDNLSIQSALGFLVTYIELIKCRVRVMASRNLSQVKSQGEMGIQKDQITTL